MRSRFTSVAAALAAIALTGSVLYALTTLEPQPGLRQPVVGKLSETGVSNPVTAVLLSFRGYDTLLEVCAVLIAAIAVWSLAALPRSELPVLTPNPMLTAVLRWLLPAGVLMSGYVLWKGSFAPGGAFQSAAILAALAILLVVTGVKSGTWTGGRLFLSVGSLAFLFVAFLPLLWGWSFMRYRGTSAGAVILLVEVAAALSVATSLTLFFIGGRVEDGGR